MNDVKFPEAKPNWDFAIGLLKWFWNICVFFLKGLWGAITYNALTILITIFLVIGFILKAFYEKYKKEESYYICHLNKSERIIGFIDWLIRNFNKKGRV
jgi:hypothetical protein